MEYNDQEKAYLEDRFKSQEIYYDRKSAHNKRWHQSIQLFIAVGSVAVPVLLGISEIPKLVPTILSLMVAAVAGIENVFHFGDNWRIFRLTLESLKREKALYRAGAGPYKNPQTAFTRFVERSENVIAEETVRYFEHEEEALQRTREE